MGMASAAAAGSGSPAPTLAGRGRGANPRQAAKLREFAVGACDAWRPPSFSHLAMLSGMAPSLVPRIGRRHRLRTPLGTGSHTHVLRRPDSGRGLVRESAGDE